MQGAVADDHGRERSDAIRARSRSTSRPTRVRSGPGDNTVAVFNGATCNARLTCRLRPEHPPWSRWARPRRSSHDAAPTTPSTSPTPTAVTVVAARPFDARQRDLQRDPSRRLPDHAPPTVTVAWPTRPPSPWTGHPYGVRDHDRNVPGRPERVGRCSTRAPATRPCSRDATSSADSSATAIGPPTPAGRPRQPDPVHGQLRQHRSQRLICVAATPPTSPAARPHTPGTVTVAPINGLRGRAFWLVVDAPLHTVYVVNQKDDTVSAIDTNVCNGSHLSACATLQPPTVHTGEDPEVIALNPDTQTLYTANQVSNDVSVIDASRCNATDTRGCREPPPALPSRGPARWPPIRPSQPFTSRTSQATPCR